MYDLNRPDDTPPSILAPAVIPSGVQPVADPAVEFRQRIAALTPDLFVARTLIALNIVIFLVMLLNNVSPMQPSIDSLIRWGADYGPKTVTGGQWWRLLTSMFLHIGIIHIAFNMFVFWQIGPFVERLLGNVGFTIVYFVSGIAGAFVSVAWNPYIVSAGASGAIFGLYGALLGFLCIRRDSIPADVLSPLMRNALIFIGYNVVYGMLRTGTDVAAHLGGLGSGFICGLCLSVPLTLDPPPRRAMRNAALALGAAALFVLTAYRLPRPIDFQAEVRRFSVMEKNVLTTYNADLVRARQQHLRDDQLADLVAKDVLPAWTAEHDRLAQLKGLKGPSEHLLSALVDYMEARQQAWTMLVTALRQHDIPGVRMAMLKQHEAEVAVNAKIKSAKP